MKLHLKGSPSGSRDRHQTNKSVWRRGGSRSSHSSSSLSPRKSDRLAHKRRTTYHGRAGRRSNPNRASGQPNPNLPSQEAGDETLVDLNASATESDNEGSLSEAGEGGGDGHFEIVEDSQQPDDLLEIPAAALPAAAPAAAPNGQETQDPGNMADNEETQPDWYNHSDKENDDPNHPNLDNLVFPADYENFMFRVNSDEIQRLLRRQDRWSSWIWASNAKWKTLYDAGAEDRERMQAAEGNVHDLIAELTETKSQLTETRSQLAEAQEQLANVMDTIARVREVVVPDVDA